jgi:hypothetical protein
MDKFSIVCRLDTDLEQAMHPYIQLHDIETDTQKKVAYKVYKEMQNTFSSCFNPYTP